jgi:fructosamine-3-kinase
MGMAQASQKGKYIAPLHEWMTQKDPQLGWQTTQAVRETVQKNLLHKHAKQILVPYRRYIGTTEKDSAIVQYIGCNNSIPFGEFIKAIFLCKIHRL